MTNNHNNLYLITEADLKNGSYEIAHIRVKTWKLVIIGNLFALIVLIALFFLAVSLPHFNVPDRRTALLLFLAFLVFIPGSIVIHEWLHFVAYKKFGKVRSESLKFGYLWRSFIAYCNCEVPVPISVYKTAGFFPLYFFGPFAFVIILVYPSFFTALVASIALSGSVGDIMILLKLRNLPKNSIVLDRSTELGCDIYWLKQAMRNERA